MAKAWCYLWAWKESAATLAAFPLFSKPNIFGPSIAAMFSVFVCNPHLLQAMAESNLPPTTAFTPEETIAFVVLTSALFRPSHLCQLVQTPRFPLTIPTNWEARDNLPCGRSVCPFLVTRLFIRAETRKSLA